jgi:hypothetical protein
MVLIAGRATKLSLELLEMIEVELKILFIVASLPPCF